MKKFICTFFAAAMFFTSAVYADTNVFYSGQLINYSDQVPVIINDRTYIPIRDVFETMGFKVNWYPESKIVEIVNEHHEIMLFTKTSGMFTVDRQLGADYKALENTVKIVNGRTMLPLREILETVDYTLAWDAETKSTYITDANNYTLLNAKKAELDTMMSNSLDFSPSSDLSEDEYEFAKNVADVLKQTFTADITSDFAANSNQKTYRELTAYSEKAASVKCPDTFKGLDKNIAEAFDNIKAEASKIAEVYAANGEDADDISATLSALFKAEIKKEILTALQPYDDLFAK